MLQNAEGEMLMSWIFFLWSSMRISLLQRFANSNVCGLKLSTIKQIWLIIQKKKFSTVYSFIADANDSDWSSATAYEKTECEAKHIQLKKVSASPHQQLQIPAYVVTIETIMHFCIT